MIQASKLIALQTPGLLMQHTCWRPALIDVVQDHRDARVYLRYRHRWRPFFSPARFPSLKTRWRVMTAFGDDATPSNSGPHSLLTQPRSCCAGGILRCDVRLWPHEPTATAVSLSPGHGPTYCPAPPAYSARPDEQGGDETSMDVPSRHRPRSTRAGAACHWSATCPMPTGAASDTGGGRWAHRLGRAHV